MKFSTNKIVGLSLAFALLVTGCNKQEAQTPTKSDDNQAQNTVKTEPTTPATAPICDDVASKNSLVRALSVAVNDEVLGLMDSYKNADKLDLARRTQQRLGQINLDLQNIRADGDSCLADVVAVVPAGDLSYAERHYQASGKPSLAELGNQHSIQMSDGRIVTPVRYNIQDGKVSLSETPSALGFIANIVSASAYMTAQGAGQVDIDARPAVNVGTPPRMDSPRPARPALREPQIPMPSNDDNNGDNGNDNATSNTTTSTTTSTNNANAGENANDSTQPASTKPKAQTTKADASIKPEPKSAPVEGDGELVIVESDETY